MEDDLIDQNIFRFRKIKKTTQTGQRASSSWLADDDDENEASFREDDSYDPSNEDAPPTASMNTFRMEIKDEFEQFELTQDPHGT